MSEEHPPQFEGGVELGDPIEEEPGGIGARDRERSSWVGRICVEIAGDDLEEACGGFGEERGQRGGFDPQAEIGGMFEDFMHGAVRGMIRAGGRGVAGFSHLLVDRRPNHIRQRRPGDGGQFRGWLVRRARAGSGRG